MKKPAGYHALLGLQYTIQFTAATKAAYSLTDGIHPWMDTAEVASLGLVYVTSKFAVDVIKEQHSSSEEGLPALLRPTDLPD